ncbi:hypothetical protein HMF3257_25605 [Spirosoma telluris]|uniref:Uncharacterized protein n=1 Tax=Spirosoma telluris TaxID=2183553 RepID=A0A327NSC0_9BACT|nr:hypothetical protein HMF3257_25605 [Spirosoma telluris]
MVIKLLIIELFVIAMNCLITKLFKLSFSSNALPFLFVIPTLGGISNSILVKLEIPPKVGMTKINLGFSLKKKV